MLRSTRNVRCAAMMGIALLPTLALAQTRAVFASSDGAAQITRLQVSTTTGTVDLNATFRGWYSADGSNNGRSPAGNYLAGRCDAVPLCFTPAIVLNNWFTFDLANVTGRTITGATLFLDSPAGVGYLSANPSETFSLFDVATVLNTLGIAVGVSIFNDLGSGTLFGTRSVSAADNGTSVASVLNSSALAALTSAQGASFGIGGAVTLTTTLLPEPSTYVLMLVGLAAVGVAARRRRVLQ